jgi:hypothetical protein
VLEKGHLDEVQVASEFLVYVFLPFHTCFKRLPKDVMLPQFEVAQKILVGNGMMSVAGVGVNTVVRALWPRCVK